MPLRVVGAGLGRTGTHSLKVALEQLLGEPCYPMPDEWTAMITDLFRNFAGDTLDKASAIAAFERHNEYVRSTAPPERLLEWHPGDGWEPICTALGVDVPAEPFPHVNSTAEFRAM